MTTTCHLTVQQTHPFSATRLFTVVRDPNNAGYWRMYVDGSFVAAKGPLGWNAGVSLAGGEWTGSPGSNYHARFGLAPASTVWQIQTTLNGTFINVPASSQNVFSDPDAFTTSGNAPSFSVNR